MNHHVRTIGDATPVISRFGSENSITRPEKLLDVLCYNNTGGTLYMQVFEITNSLVPFGTAYAAGSYTLNGLTVGHTYHYNAVNSTDLTLVNGAQTITFATAGAAGTFVANATSITLTGTGTNIIGTRIVDRTVPNAVQAPASGSTPMFAFPVQSGLGGTLGRCIDITGIFCGWSSTALTYTPVLVASGSINIVVKA